ncbi:MAG: sugar phosphate isomerase/epimerase [Planctomycetes bacterium]|nr:sugar phosphate isomerase/epimerase [Planctomycetota bacterium]
MKNDFPQNRRLFLQTGTLAAAGWLAGKSLLSSGSALAADRTDTAPDAGDGKRPLKLALASYTLRKFSLEETLAMTRRVGLTAICLKSFHLPLDASEKQIAETRQKVAQAGLTLYGGGVIVLRNREQIDQAFDYAKSAGMKRIIGAPTVETLPLINEKIQQYDIEVAIHNHGPGDKHFPTPDVAYEKIKKFDPRFGLCHDVGHTVRYGKDPVAITEKCADRMLDVHMKDVTSATRKGRATPCGRGVVDIPTLLRALIKTGYKGYLAFEYESDPNDPLPGLAESVGYVRGVLDTL